VPPTGVERVYSTGLSILSALGVDFTAVILKHSPEEDRKGFDAQL